MIYQERKVVCVPLQCRGEVDGFLDYIILVAMRFESISCIYSLILYEWVHIFREIRTEVILADSAAPLTSSTLPDRGCSRVSLGARDERIELELGRLLTRRKPCSLHAAQSLHHRTFGHPSSTV